MKKTLGLIILVVVLLIGAYFNGCFMDNTIYQVRGDGFYYVGHVVKNLTGCTVYPQGGGEIHVSGDYTLIGPPPGGWR
jgi:hypothetical protein